MAAEYHVAVVGGGIVGLATARQIMLDRPKARVVVIEKETGVARHQTGHNSGVIHSGVYYAPNTLKSRLCLTGKAQLERYATETGIPFRTTGKLIVALGENDKVRLAALHRRGRESLIPGLTLLSRAELRELEPNVEGQQALLIPGSGVIDYSQVAGSLADDFTSRGGEIRLGRTVVGITSDTKSAHLETTQEAVSARTVIACAGLQSDRVAALSGDVPDRPRIVPFRGDYYTLSARAAELISRMIYPVPDPALPFLGVHFTKRVDGSVIVGPNAVLSLARERYRRAAVNTRDVLSTTTFPGFWKFAAQHVRTGAAELWRDISKTAYLREMQQYVPSVTAADLTFGPSGIRAQALDVQGRLVDDFVIETRGAVTHVVNAPSPAATSALAIGSHLADVAGRSFD